MNQPVTKPEIKPVPPPSLQLYYQIYVHDAGGRLLRKTKPRKSRSFVRQFLQLLLSQWKAASISGLALVDVTDVDRVASVGGAVMVATGAANDDTQSVVVGTGTNAVTVSDNKLQTKVAHGVGAGQLQYQASALSTNVTLNGLQCTFTLTRAYINGSGGAIVVGEIGLYAICTSFDFCLIRDMLAATESVANGETLTVVYTIRITA